MPDSDTEQPESGKVLRAWRKRLGWTQTQAAAALGIHLHSLKNLEAGKRAVRSSLRRLLESLERDGTEGARPQPGRSPEPSSGPLPAPSWAALAPLDAELLEVGRRYGKACAAHVEGLLKGELTPELVAEMKAAERELHRMKAMKDLPFSDEAMGICGAFILVSNAAQRAAFAAIAPAGAVNGPVVYAADMRHGTLSEDVFPTMTAGGQGISVNSTLNALILYEQEVTLTHYRLRETKLGGRPQAADTGDAPATGDATSTDLGDR